MKNDKTLTDASYEFVDRLEWRKRWFIVIIFGCFILAPIGLGSDFIAFFVLSRQKGGLLDQQIVYLAVVFIISLLMVLFGFNIYKKFKKLSKNLNHLRVLEETIYKEVLQTKSN
jgi:hypothetical protein